VKTKVTAVKVLCPRAHLIATIHPEPALGVASKIRVRTMPARYRPGLATYLRNAADEGWTTQQGTEQVLTVDKFMAGGWARSITWACRCGLSQIDEQSIITAALSWNTERKKDHGNPPPPRVVNTHR
jgi:hypothetical protein